ncbi:hypothetical protein K438DRAFT_2000461 [Mycena galopus ATCC 62051]|nr:hypothetical protein K438DRAFT_2000461 [Mycena galopus ATCC 62051]
MFLLEASACFSLDALWTMLKEVLIVHLESMLLISIAYPSAVSVDGFLPKHLSVRSWRCSVESHSSRSTFHLASV